MSRRTLAALLLASLALTGNALAQSVSSHALDDGQPTAVRARYLLVGPDGGAVTDQAFRGRLQLITFGYTFCPDVCPTTLLEMAEVLRLLGDAAAAMQAIFVTVDPARDTPATLKIYTDYFDPRILGLGGSPELIQRAAANFKVRYAKVPASGKESSYYAVDHSAGIYLLDKDGEFVRKFAYGTPPAQIASAIQSLVNGE